jgi:MFS family permease
MSESRNWDVEEPSQSAAPWYRELNRYQWFVLTVAALGWLFDTMDQQLFVLARQPAMRELLAGAEGPPSDGEIARYSGYATSVFLLGWATGGLAFGVLGDRIGRARTMVLTILLYSSCTGLSALAWDFTSFAVFRFVTGLGVGGEFAVGAALVAEVMPDRVRPFALGLLQALSAIGNITAAALSMLFGYLETQGWLGSHGEVQTSSWRALFVVGALPALLAVIIRRRLREPERWVAVAQDRSVERRLGSYAELFGNPRWAGRAAVGLLLAFPGVVGLWGIGFFSVDLLELVLRRRFESLGLSPSEISGRVAFWKGVTSMMLNLGAFCGIYAFSYLTHWIGRRPAFAISFLAAMLSTILTFWTLHEFSQIFWMIPLMGFCQLSLFGGYAIYFPELFPTHLRSTGTSFCYNVGRFVGACGPSLLGILTSHVFRDFPEPMRYAGMSLSAIFLLGLLVLPLAPETKGKPLPD